MRMKSMKLERFGTKNLFLRISITNITFHSFNLSLKYATDLHLLHFYVQLVLHYCIQSIMNTEVQIHLVRLVLVGYLSLRVITATVYSFGRSQRSYNYRNLRSKLHEVYAHPVQ